MKIAFQISFDFVIKRIRTPIRTEKRNRYTKHNTQHTTYQHIPTRHITLSAQHAAMTNRSLRHLPTPPTPLTHIRLSELIELQTGACNCGENRCVVDRHTLNTQIRRAYKQIGVGGGSEHIPNHKKRGVVFLRISQNRRITDLAVFHRLAISHSYRHAIKCFLLRSVPER